MKKAIRQRRRTSFLIRKCSVFKKIRCFTVCQFQYFRNGISNSYPHIEQGYKVFFFQVYS